MSTEPTILYSRLDATNCAKPEDRVPRTDEEVKYVLYYDYSEGGVRDPMWGLYCVRRLQGMSVIEAWEATLMDAVGEGKK